MSDSAATRGYSEEAFDLLYDHLDRYGAGKRTAYLISALIDAKIKEALEDAGADRVAQMQADPEYQASMKRRMNGE